MVSKKQKGKSAKKPPARSKASAVKTAARQTKPKPDEKVLLKRRVLKLQSLSVLLIGFALFCAISLAFDITGKAGLLLREILLGLLGGGGYLFPAVLGVICVYTAKYAARGKLFAFNFSALLFLLIFSSLLHVFTAAEALTAQLSALYQFGIENFVSGGVLGGLLTSLLFPSLGKVGLAILYIALSIILVMVAFGFTLEPLFIKISKKSKEPSPSVPPAPVISRGVEADSPEDLKDYEREFPAPPARKKAAAAPTAFDDDIPPFKTETIAPPIFSFEKNQEAKATIDSSKITKKDIAAEEKAVGELISSEASVKKEYSFPPVSLLTPDRQSVFNGEDLQATALKIENTLKSFGVDTSTTAISRGPTVTRYELAPSQGVRISKITNLADDIALSLAATGVRIEAPIPGKSAVGIEVPNKNIFTVFLRSLIESDQFRRAQSKLSFALGCDIGGENIMADISKMPHLLIAGATGSGKSVCINSLIVSLLYKASPDEVRLIMIDPKVVELGVYNGIPHLLLPVVTDTKKASGTLSWAVGEMIRRYKLFAEHNARDIRGFNLYAESVAGVEKLPRIVIIIDELADLMMASPGEVEDAICRLAQMARAAGMHLVIATQRPSVDVITGTIKANIPSRIAFAVSSQVDSRTILDMGGAEKLIGRGDMLFSPVGTKKPMRLQGCFVSDKEVESVVDFVKRQAEADYDEKVIEEIEKKAAERAKGASSKEDDGEDDPMLSDAIQCVVEAGSASTSTLQRRLKLGYARAARLIDEMESRGIVGPFQGSKPRAVLITKQQLYEMQMRQAEAPHSSVEAAEEFMQNDLIRFAGGSKDE